MKQCQRIIFSYKVIELTLVLVCHLLLTKCIYRDGLEGFSFESFKGLYHQVIVILCALN